MNKLTIIILLLTAGIAAQAQEYLLPASAPTHITTQKNRVVMRAVSSTLQLPFIDDFSYNQNLPDQEKWESRGVWINNNYGINPYSAGVATFDAINSDGLHYSNASSTPYIADNLTSKAIDMSQADSTTTFISFYYQPQGNGNAPEPCDSLVLQITSGDGEWTNLWATAGTDFNTFRDSVLHIGPDRPDTLKFAFVMLPISNPKYFTRQFRFRFFNYASLTGNYNPSAAINCDHWNIDFVYLADKRSQNDTLFADLAIVEPAITMLKNYTSIPWKHYNDAIDIENTRLAIHLRNHWNRNMKAEVRIRIKDEDSDVYLNDSITLGTANYEGLYNTKITYSYDDNPITYDDSRETASYLFECEIYPDKNDLIVGNNIAYTRQYFGNYYSYDDGSAENAYGVDAATAQVAYLFTPYTADNLYGISICFVPSNPIESAATDFCICAWENNNGKPGKQLLCESVSRPDFSGEMNQFMDFEFSSPIRVEKSIFVGWQQVSALRLNVGWDVNRFSQSKIFYNTTGNWLNTSFNGSLMMRPLFGAPISGIQNATTASNTISVEPNPASNTLTIIGLNTDAEYDITIYNAMGQICKQSKSTTIDVSNLHSGVYIIRAVNAGTILTTRFVKQ